MSNTQQPLPVSGYTAQQDTKVALVNQNKMIEELAMRQLDLMAANGDTDKRMVALAKTGIQDAFMWMNRAVFQPERLTDAQMQNIDTFAKVMKG